MVGFILFPFSFGYHFYAHMWVCTCQGTCVKAKGQLFRRTFSPSFQSALRWSLIHPPRRCSILRLPGPQALGGSPVSTSALAIGMLRSYTHVTISHFFCVVPGIKQVARLMPKPAFSHTEPLCALQQGFVLRNPLLDYFIIVQTSQSILTQTCVILPMHTKVIWSVCVCVCKCCISYFSHCCNKISNSCHSREGMAPGAWLWSHCMCSREAERDERQCPAHFPGFIHLKPQPMRWCL